MASPAPTPPPPSTLMDYTLRTAPLNVVIGTASCTALGALTGSTLGIIRNYPAIPAAFKTGVNTGVFSFAFFSTREYVLHPLLVTLSLRPSPLDQDAPPHPHTHNLGSSALAGTIAGALFSGYMRGGPPSASLRAGLTLGLGCAVAQGLVNELEVGRIKLLGWGEERERRLRELDAVEGSAVGEEGEKVAPPTYTRDISHATPSVPSRETFSERSDRLIGEAWSGMWRKLERLAPLKKMDEGEYVAKLEGRLRDVEEQRREVEREVKELEGRKGVA